MNSSQSDFASNLVYGNELHLLSLVTEINDSLPAETSEWIGVYRLIELLGEGGFGYVWLAEQTEPVRREVALKLLKRGMDSDQVLARFSLERQALASMDHPNIASLLDAGSTADGRPFFVMERVRGKPVKTWCQERALTIPELVGLFKQICSGVQHAHQKGIIHRDLKPSNILVADVDGAAVPKIIDFGIAKATSDQHSDLPYATRMGHVMGTPLYMSPEQLAGSLDVDTRSDIYALGVLFYEMLTGDTPHESKTHAGITHEEMRHIVNTERPQRPSIRLTEIKRLRGQVAVTLVPLSHIFADLDWIILKALEKDRERRYESVALMTADLQSFLNAKPVQARPPSARYIVGLWVRRHRVVFAAGSVCALTLLVGTGLALWQAQEARKAQARAEIEVQRTLQAVNFLTTMLDHVAEEINLGRNPEALKLALAGSESQIRLLDHDPALQSNLFRRVGWLYEKMGERKFALPLLKAHIELLGRIHGVDHQMTWDAEHGYLIIFVDHGARIQAPALIEDLLQRIEKQGQRGSSFWFNILQIKITAYIKLRRAAEAKVISENALREPLLPSLPGNRQIQVKIICSDALREAGDFTAAEFLVDECLRLSMQDPSAAIYVPGLESKLLYIQRAKGDHDRGAEILREKIARIKNAVGESHQELIEPLLLLTEFERDSKQYLAAISHAREALAITRVLAPSPLALQGCEGVQTQRRGSVRALVALADNESLLGQHPQAISDAREAFHVADEQGQTSSIEESLLMLAVVQHRSGDQDAAFETYRLRYQRSGQRGANYQRWHEDLQSMCAIRLRQGRAAEALQLAEELWSKETASAVARQDEGHLRDIADLALSCYASLKKVSPNGSEPASLAAWRMAAKKSR